MSIRLRLLLVSSVLLVLPLLAAQFVERMETFLRSAQEQSIRATARAVASALSDRQALFPRTVASAEDAEAEERRRIVALFGSSDPDAVANLGAAYVPSEEVERFLDIMGRRASRVWVVDTRSRVRGLSGNLKDSTRGAKADARESVQPKRWLSGLLTPIVALVVSTPQVPTGDETKPVRAQIDRALIGVSSTQWRGTRDRDVAILSAAQPIFIGDDIVGAAIVEETTGSIQILKESALEDLLAVTLAVVAGALAILLIFATRLAARIRKLHGEADGAIDAQGRIRGAISASDAQDEIGDLSRTMAAVLDRLKEYNAYLEAMAGRLSHELRTPVAVVRSSLDNLKAEPLPASARVYLERAGEGVERLSRLIARLSEATRLERLLESAEREAFDLAKVVAGCVEGYRATYPDRKFDYEAPSSPVMIHGVPDAFAQLLDKLVDNARDFAPSGTAIRVSLAAGGGGAKLAVENDGAPVPEPMRARLFDSMVTSREGEHLGLGLYIVRIVAEFHGGRVRVHNLPGGKGVRFEVEVQ
jgi:dedicated sortase system histidine kinase